MTKQTTNPVKKKRELLSKNVTTTWEYNDRTVIHSKTQRKKDNIYLSKDTMDALSDFSVSVYPKRTMRKPE